MLRPLVIALALLCLQPQAQARHREEQPQPVRTTFDGLPLYSNVPAGATLLKAYDTNTRENDDSLCDLKANLSLNAEKWIIEMQKDRTLDAYFSSLYFVISGVRSQTKYLGTTYGECRTGLGGTIGNAISSFFGFWSGGLVDLGEASCHSKAYEHFGNVSSAKLLIYGVQRAPLERAAIFTSIGCGYIKNQGDPRCRAGAVYQPSPMIIGVVDDAPTRACGQ